MRERIVQAVASGRPQLVVARTYGVGVATVQRYLYRQRREGSVEARPLPSRPPRVGRDQEGALRAPLEATPDATLSEYCKQWAREQGMAVSITTMHRAIARLHWTRK